MNREFKINNFDLLRLFAACEVLFLHSFWHLDIQYPAFFQVMSNFPGVAMFFVMSGFLISGSLERNHDLRMYFRNRVLRIFPALWTCLALSIIVISIVSGISFINKQSVPWLISQCAGIIYTPAFLSKFGFGSYNGSLWTIPLELQFYVILPIIYFLLSITVKKEKAKSFLILILFIVFCMITFAIKNYYDTDNFDSANIPKILRYTFIPNIYLFLLGVVLQRFNVYQSNLIFGKGLFWLVCYLLINYLVPTSNVTYIFKLCFLGITTISLAYTLPSAANKILKGNDISYGVYIYHGLVLGVFVQLKLIKNSNYVAIIFLITVILAILSWLFIEKTFIKRKRKAIHRITQVSLV